MDEVSFLIMKLVVSVSVALITAYLVPFLRSKISVETQEQIAGVVSVAVKAAEQTMQGGTVKKEAVMDYVMNWVALHNIKITREQANQLVEAIVYEIKQEKKSD